VPSLPSSAHRTHGLAAPGPREPGKPGAACCLHSLLLASRCLHLGSLEDRWQQAFKNQNPAPGAAKTQQKLTSISKE